MSDYLDNMESDIDILAGEYVIGTLPIEQRRDVEQRMANDDALRAAVDRWEARMLPLAAIAEPVTPTPQLWSRIAASVGQETEPVKAAPRRAPADMLALAGLWNSLAFWRSFTAVGFTAAAVLAAVTVNRPLPTTSPQYVVVLAAPQSQAAGWIVQAQADNAVQLVPLAATVVPEGQALEFWTKADGWAGPVSLGLVKPGQSIRVPLDKLPPLQPNQLFELTLEPAAGSPVGKPTGPVQFIGRAVKTS